MAEPTNLSESKVWEKTAVVVVEVIVVILLNLPKVNVELVPIQGFILNQTWAKKHNVKENRDDNEVTKQINHTKEPF